MCPIGKKPGARKEILPFTYPRLHTKKNWYVDFRCLDPATGMMRRKKYMLDNIPKAGERRKRAAELIEALIKQLRGGWSPWAIAEDCRGYSLLSDVLDRYGAFIERMDKYKTRKSYSSRLSVFREYIASRIVTPKYVYQYDRELVSDFLDWILLDRECGARTRNNYRGWCSSLALFLIERKYISENPAEKIRTMAEAPKKRQPLTPEMLRRLAEHLKESDPYFLLACRMEYYTFIRPTELVNVRVCDISVKEQSVFIPASVSKNKRDGKVGLNADTIRLMLDLGILSLPGETYIFGRDMRPSIEKASSEIFRKRWLKVRKALKWKDEFQFYSLKDSGLRDLANSEGIVIARDQARHTDVSTTNKYLQGRDQPVHEETKRFSGNL
ncbi:MAG: site-specific integrase [Clostridium sp.]|nr:site-specific integrase [Clostridium sp.]